jgi:hypothetical protein
VVESVAVVPAWVPVASVRLRVVASVAEAPTKFTAASTADSVVMSVLVPLSIKPLIATVLISDTLNVVESAVPLLERIAAVSAIDSVVESTVAVDTAVVTDSVREIVVESVRTCAAKSPVSASKMLRVVTSEVIIVTGVGVTTASTTDRVVESTVAVPT